MKEWTTNSITLPFVALATFISAMVVLSVRPSTLEAADQTRSVSAMATLHKDPKLSSILAILRSAVPQEPGPPVASQTALRMAVVEAKLSKEVRDAMHSHQMNINKDGEVQVYIEGEEATSDILQSLAGIGVKVQIIGRPQPYRQKGEVYSKIPTIQALVPANKLEALKDLAWVHYVRLPDYGILSTGSVDTQGDNILQAEMARANFGVDGTKVKIGVLSSGIAGVFANGCTMTCGSTPNNPSPMSLGDLPGASGARNSSGVLISVTGGITATSMRADGDLEDTDDGSAGAEGTALLEIVHDLAPGASLYFANSDTQMAFEKAVDYLAENCDVVVDDMSFLTPPYDGTSSVSANTSGALNANSNPIRGYFTAVGDLAQNHYQGMYVSSGFDGTSYTGFAGNLHLFQMMMNVTTDTESLGAYPFDPILSVGPGDSATVYLAWDDPAGASTNDYDLFLLPLTCGLLANGLPTKPCKIAGPSVASSTNRQTGTQDPTEMLTWTNDTGATAVVGIAIQNYQDMALARTFDVFVGSPGAKGILPNHNFNTVSGSVPAQSDSGGSPASVLSIGAIDQSQCLGPGNCLNSVELYSSQGPTQTTPQSAARVKPDLVTTDDVCITGAGKFGQSPSSNTPPTACPTTAPAQYTPNVFRGTSAAAPHAAAIAALALQAAPCLLSSSSNPLPPAKARMNLSNALVKNAISLPGVATLPTVAGMIPNNVEGNGLLDAFTATLVMLPTVSAGTSQTVNATSPNGASVVLATANPIGTDPNSCPLTTVEWSGNCGTGQSADLHPSLSCPIGVNAVYLSVSNNGTSFSQPTTVPYTVIVSDFILSASPATATVSSGTPATYTISVTPTSQGSFSNSVALTCTQGLPPGGLCSFSPPSVAPGAAATPSVLTVLLPATTMAMPNSPSLPSDIELAISYCILLLFFSLRRSASGLPMGRLVSTALLVCLLLGGLGCSSKTPAPTPATYSLTITGTSNQLVHTITVSLTVQ